MSIATNAVRLGRTGLFVLLVGIGAISGRPLSAAPLIDAHFALSDLGGHQTTELDFHGKWQLVYFGYTYCPDVCPTTLTEIGAALHDLGPAANRFQPIFITLDPARDSPKVLAQYLKAFDPRFIGLRGNGLDTAETAERFHVYYRLRSLGHGEYTVDHSSFIYVIDPNGKFDEILSSDLPGHSLADALRKLVGRRR